MGYFSECGECVASVSIFFWTIQHGDSTFNDSTSGIFCVIIPSVDLQLRLVYTCEGTRRVRVIRRNQQQQQMWVVGHYSTEHPSLISEHS